LTKIAVKAVTNRCNF